MIACFRNSELNFLKCDKTTVDVESEDYLLSISNVVHMEGNHKGMQAYCEELRDRYFTLKLFL